MSATDVLDTRTSESVAKIATCMEGPLTSADMLLLLRMAVLEGIDIGLDASLALSRQRAAPTIEAAK